jgi:hypothetical protein
MKPDFCLAKMFNLKSSYIVDMTQVSNQPARPVPSEQSDTHPRPVGRPPAKHSSPDYSQMTVYVRRDVRKAVKIRLFEEELEMSALVEKLLSYWLASHDSNK